MATHTSFTNDLKAQLACAFCKEIFTDPRKLPCAHAFCFKCIKSWNDSCHKENKPLVCPTCRIAIDVEGGDISKLPSSFTYTSLIQLFEAMSINPEKQSQQQLPECVKCSRRRELVGFCPQCKGMICGECMANHERMRKITHQATPWSEFTKQNVNDYINNQALCKEKYHEQCSLEYYCKACSKFVCQKCIETAHGSHDKVSIGEACEDAKIIIRKDKDQLNELLNKYKEELELSKENMKRIQRETDIEKEKVRSETKALMKILQDHEDALIAALDDNLVKQTTANDDENTEINANVQQVTEVMLQCEIMQDTNIEHFIFEGCEALQDVCKKTIQKTSGLPTKPDKGNSSLRYIHNAEAISLMKKIKLGELRVTGPPCSAIESGSSVGFDSTNKEFRDTSDAKAVFQPLKFFNIYLNYPKSLAVNDTGCVAVMNSDYYGKTTRVRLFNADGVFFREFGGSMPGDGLLNHPYAVFINEDKILVSDHEYLIEGRPNQSYLKEFGQRTFFTHPHGHFKAMCASDEGIACLIDRNQDGNYIATIDKRSGDCLHETKLDVPLDSSRGTAVFLAYGNNKYFVSFQFRDTVFVFDKNGSLLYTFGCHGSDEGQFYGLKGLAVFGKEMLLACDYSNDRVQVFSQDGQFITSFGSNGVNLGQMVGPFDVAAAPDGRVFVLEYGSGPRVQVWKFSDEI